MEEEEVGEGEGWSGHGDTDGELIMTPNNTPTVDMVSQTNVTLCGQTEKHKERPRQTHETTQQRNTKHATRVTQNTRQDKRRQDKTRQDETRQDKCIYSPNGHLRTSQRN